MIEYIDIINKVLSLGTIILQIFTLGILLNLIIFKNFRNKISLFIKKYTFHMGFLASFGAVLMSLFYSEIIGYPPCELCWIQRIFLYPQMILFGMELIKKERSIIDFSIVFSILGSITSIYHIYLESGGSSFLSCSSATSSGNQISCAIRYIYEFGYVTIPVMALSLSLFLLVILVNYKFSLRNN
jgi:disulfide bond formation protein DsbB